MSSHIVERSLLHWKTLDLSSVTGQKLQRLQSWPQRKVGAALAQDGVSSQHPLLVAHYLLELQGFQHPPLASKGTTFIAARVRTQLKIKKVE